MTQPNKPIRRACHARLRRGEYKRVPKPVTMRPVAYYFACLSCGFAAPHRTKFINHADGLPVTERGGVVIEFGPMTCPKCGHKFAVRDGKFADA